MKVLVYNIVEFLEQKLKKVSLLPIPSKIFAVIFRLSFEH